MKTTPYSMLCLDEHKLNWKGFECYFIYFVFPFFFDRQKWARQFSDNSTYKSFLHVSSVCRVGVTYDPSTTNCIYIVCTYQAPVQHTEAKICVGTFPPFTSNGLLFESGSVARWGPNAKRDRNTRTHSRRSWERCWRNVRWLTTLALTLCSVWFTRARDRGALRSC